MIADATPAAPAVGSAFAENLLPGDLWYGFSGLRDQVPQFLQAMIQPHQWAH